MRNKEVLYLWALGLFLVALIDEIFPRIYPLPPIAFLGINIHTIFFIRSFVAMIQWLLLLLFFQGLPVRYKSVATNGFCFILLGHAVSVIFVSLSPEAGLFYFQLMHRMLKVVSSGLLGLVLFIVFKNQLINIGSWPSIRGVINSPRSYWFVLLLYLVAWILSYVHFAWGAIFFVILNVLMVFIKGMGREWKLVAHILLSENALLMAYFHFTYN